MGTRTRIRLFASSFALAGVLVAVWTAYYIGAPREPSVEGRGASAAEWPGEPLAPLERRAVDGSEARSLLPAGEVAGEGVHLRFVDARSGAPLDEVRVVVTDPGNGAQEEYTAGSDGWVVLEQGGSGSRPVECRREGYVPRSLLLVQGLGVFEVPMFPAAHLVVRLVGRDGAVPAGERVRLLPPTREGIRAPDGWDAPDATEPIPTPLAADDVWSDGPTTPWQTYAGTFERIFAELGFGRWDVTTDASGTCEWSGVPALAGYRVGLLSGKGRWSFLRSLEAVPPPGGDVRVLDDGRIARTVDLSASPDASQLRVSPSFTLQPGRNELEFELCTPSRVTGRVALAGPHQPVRGRASLLRVLAPIRTERAALSGNFAENRVELAADGSFRFDEALPGDKLVRVEVQDERGAYWLLHIRFPLAPGESRDLGTLRPSGDAGLEVSLSFQDPNGSEIDPDELFPYEGERLFELHVGVGKPGGEGTFAILPLPWPGGILIEGLPAEAEVRLSVGPLSGFDGDLEPAPGWHIDPPAEPISVRPGRTSRALIEIPAERVFEVPIVYRAPAADLSASAWAKVEGDRVVCIGPRRRGNGPWSSILRIARSGEVELFVYATESPGWAVFRRLTVDGPPAAPFEVPLDPAAGIRCVRSAAAAPERDVQVLPAGWPLDSGIPGWDWPEGEEVLEIPGLPPRMAVQLVVTGLDLAAPEILEVATPGPGEWTEIHL